MSQQKVDPSVKKCLERKHFQEALDALRGASEYGRMMADQVFGEIVEAEESPDFIMKMPSRSDTLIGVEHLHTDPSGREYSNRGRRSRPPTHQSELKRVRRVQDALQEDGRRIDWDDREQVSRIVERLNKIISDDARILSESDAPRQIEDLKLSLQHHLQKTESYRNNVQNYGSHMSPRHEYGGLVFYIDMQCDYSYFTINQPGQPPRQCRQGELPVFPEIIQLIREAAEDDVRWVLISTSTLITDEMTSALLFDTTDIETSMRQQGLNPCLRFICQMHKPFDDERPFVHKGEVNGDNGIDLILNKKQLAGTRRQLQRLVKVEACKAIDAMEHNQAFIASPVVQLMINICGTYLLKCKRPGVPLKPGVMDRLLGLRKR
ncbi:hypothetical protein [Bifidobacterium crudilactis]|jgi:hypothetical protein|uniref:hypothetical protein n=1 Tax=Bifidobacterium crudilactis TaxID=327277 RepID=UPI002354579A|nr:hypothetical protein [Bifidobacterium crudilactis]MCI1218473.1 hypothetical protein [Bifidobacterium crudilactis]